MLKVQTRLISAPLTLWAVLLILALPMGASAQLADVTDAPISFRNATDRELTLELISVVRRNGQEVPIDVAWNVKPGQYSWLMVNGKKINGVVCTFVVRTLPGPGELPIPGPDEPSSEKVSAWSWYSWGTTEHGDFCVHFTNGDLKSHLQKPWRKRLKSSTRDEKFTPPIPSAKERYREFLQEQITRVEQAIRKDEQLANKQGWGAPLVRGLGDAYGPAMERSPSETDRNAAPVVGPVMQALGQGLSNQIAQAKAATEARLQANRQLLQKYNAELKVASTPATAPAAPGTYTPITFR